MIAIIRLHPLSKVSERKSVRKRDGKAKKKKERKETFPANTLLDQLLDFISCNAEADAGYAERENTCLPAVLTSCSRSLYDSAATNHRSSGHERLPRLRNCYSSELCPVPMGATFPGVCGRRAYIHNMQSKAEITSQIQNSKLQQPFYVLKTLFLQTHFKPRKNAKNVKFRKVIQHASHSNYTWIILHKKTPNLSTHLTISSSRRLTCTPVPLFFSRSLFSPPLPCFYLCILPAFRPPSGRETGQEREYQIQTLSSSSSAPLAQNNSSNPKRVPESY